MLCPKCGCDTSRTLWTSKGEETTKRRRECAECLTRFATVEKFERIIPPELSAVCVKKSLRNKASKGD